MAKWNQGPKRFSASKPNGEGGRAEFDQYPPFQNQNGRHEHRYVSMGVTALSSGKHQEHFVCRECPDTPKAEYYVDVDVT